MFAAQERIRIIILEGADAVATRMVVAGVLRHLDELSVALAQLNPTVGDIAGNEAKVLAARQQAADAGADLVVYAELVLVGYPPEDLMLKPAFQAEVEAAVARLAAITSDGGPAMLVGSSWREDDKLYNAAILLDGGEIAAL